MDAADHDALMRTRASAPIIRPAPSAKRHRAVVAGERQREEEEARNREEAEESSRHLPPLCRLCDGCEAEHDASTGHRFTRRP